MSEALSRPGDPVSRAIFGGMCADIRFLLEHDRPIPAVILLFAAMDALANLARPASQDEATGQDFQDWVQRYFRVSGETEVTPEEWWAARCAIVHTYGAYARAHKKPQVRIMNWMTGDTPDTRVKMARTEEVVFVNVRAMHMALVEGAQRFLTEAFKDDTRRELIEARLRELLQPLKPTGNVRDYLGRPGK